MIDWTYSIRIHFFFLLKKLNFGKANMICTPKFHQQNIKELILISKTNNTLKLILFVCAYEILLKVIINIEVGNMLMVIYCHIFSLNHLNG